jgi:endonuclease G
MPHKPASKKIDAAIEALNSVRREWLRRPGTTAVDVGFKIKDKKLTDDLAVRVHVERKIPPEALQAYELFNETGKETESVGDFPIDVLEATYGPAQPIVLDPEDVATIEAVDRKGEVSPLIGGVSCGNPRVTAGTLGSIVYDRGDCSAQILSNWHILAGSNAAAAGEEIWQPGRVDGGSSAKTVATLNRFRLDRDMDAAIAKLNGTRPHVRDILGLNPIAGMDDPTLGMNVIKSGRTTAVTEGIIDGVSLSTAINYGGSTGVNSFSNQIHIVPRPPWPAVDYEVSMGGDSGSVWINEANNKAVGLHFAGETDSSPSQENAIANPIKKVSSELNFSFFPVLCVQPPVVAIPRDRLRLILCRAFPWLCVKVPTPWTGWFGWSRPGPGVSGEQAQSESLARADQQLTYGDGDVVDAVIDAIYEEMGW